MPSLNNIKTTIHDNKFAKKFEQITDQLLGQAMDATERWYKLGKDINVGQELYAKTNSIFPLEGYDDGQNAQITSLPYSGQVLDELVQQIIAKN